MGRERQRDGGRETEKGREAGRRGSEEHGQREADGCHGDIGPREMTVRDTEPRTEKGQGQGTVPIGDSESQDSGKGVWVMTAAVSRPSTLDSPAAWGPLRYLGVEPHPSPLPSPPPAQALRRFMP